MKKLFILTVTLLLLLAGCGQSAEKSEQDKDVSLQHSSSSMAVKESSSEEVIKSESSKESEAIEDETVEETFEEVVESVPVVEESEESLPVVVTAEELMADYPQWILESGQTPADYNTKRKDEANKRLRDHGLPADDEFINRNPIRITREDEKMIRKNVGHMDYTPMEANVVLYGVILVE